MPLPTERKDAHNSPTISSEAEMFTPGGHGRVQPLPQILVALVLRKVQLIEASMTARQPIFPPVIPMDVELRETVHTLKLPEPVQRDFTRARDELQEFGTFLFIKGAHGAPKPLDLG